MIRSLLFPASLITVTSCSDTVENRYSTRADAESDTLFERGWLPDIIPQSSHHIITKNDLDLNRSNGEFFFAPDDAADFVHHLNKTGKIHEGYSSFSYANNESTWIFQINFDKGHCKYFMSLNRMPNSAGESFNEEK